MNRSAMLVTYAPFAILIAFLAPLLWPTDGVGDTFRFWYAGHIVATGGSPYDQSAWAAAGGVYGHLADNVSSTCTPTAYEPACLWAYPPLTALVFAPFGMLSVREGLDALAVFVFASAVLSLVVVGRWMCTTPPWTRAVAMCAAAVSHPFVFDVHAGHFEGLGLLGLASIALGLRSRRAAPVAFGALLLSIKPHLYVGVLVLVIGLLVARRDWRTIGWTALTAGGLNLLALARFPEALGAIFGRVGSVIDLGWATTRAFAANIVPSAPLLGPAVIYAIAFVALVAAIRRAPHGRRADALIAGGAAASLTISPYVQPYDLLILFPAFALAISLAWYGPGIAAAALVTASAGILSAGTWLAIAAGGGEAHALPGSLPVVALVLLALATYRAGGSGTRHDSRIRGTAASAPGNAGSSPP